MPSAPAAMPTAPRSPVETLGMELVKVSNVSRFFGHRQPREIYEVGSIQQARINKNPLAHIKKKIPHYSPTQRYVELPAWEALTLMRHYGNTGTKGNAQLARFDETNVDKWDALWQAAESDILPPRQFSDMKPEEFKNASDMVRKQFPAEDWPMAALQDFAKTNGFTVNKALISDDEGKTVKSKLALLLGAFAEARMNAGGQVKFPQSAAGTIARQVDKRATPAPEKKT